LNQEDGPDGLNEKKKLLDSIENYAGHICLTLREQQEIYVGKLKGKTQFQPKIYLSNIFVKIIKLFYLILKLFFLFTYRIIGWELQCQTIKQRQFNGIIYLYS